MDKRREELLRFQINLDKIDKEVTMVLQSLQWNREQLLEGKYMVTCSHNPNHRMPHSVLEQHEKDCFLRTAGYSKDEKLLPEVIDAKSPSVVKLTYQDIQKITNIASSANPQVQEYACAQPPPAPGPEPQSLARLQQRYPPGARAAIHDAVIAATVAAPDLTDFTPLLTLPSDSGGARAGACADADDGHAAELAAQAALRDMKRRRARYRTLCSGNYSNSLRTLIHSQMELYTDAQMDETQHNGNQSKDDLNVSDKVIKNTDEIVKSKIQNLNNSQERDGIRQSYYDKESFKSSRDSRRPKSDPKSDIERWREKYENSKEKEYSHSSSEKRTDYSITRLDAIDQEHSTKKIHQYSDRYDKYSERKHHKNHIEESSRRSKYRRYNDETRHTPESSTSKYYERGHKKLAEKIGPERVKSYKNHKYDKVGDGYNSNSSQDSPRSYMEKKVERSPEERKKHKKHRHEKKHKSDKERKKSRKELRELE